MLKKYYTIKISFIKSLSVALCLALSFGCVSLCYSQTKTSDENIVVDLGDLKYVFATNIKDFVTELNELGKQGYKIEQITKLPLNVNEKFDETKLAGIVSFDQGHKYEYDWFEAFIPGEIVTRINSRAKDGFYFRDRLSVTQGRCEDLSSYSTIKTDTEKLFDNIVSSLQFSEVSIFFLERKDGLSKSIDYRVEIGIVTSRDRYPEELLRNIENIGSLGFRPISMSVSKVANKYALTVLAEREKLSSNISKVNYRLISGEFGYEKKITASTKDGFELLFAGRFGAVRYALMKNTNLLKPITDYSFLKTFKKSFSTDLKRINNQDKIAFRDLMDEDWTCDSVEAVLIFQNQTSDKSIKLKYESIKIMDELKKSTKKNLNPKFISPSLEIISNIKEFLNEGYVVRDIFFSNGINLLLEKSIK